MRGERELLGECLKVFLAIEHGTPGANWSAKFCPFCSAIEEHEDGCRVAEMIDDLNELIEHLDSTQRTSFEDIPIHQRPPVGPVCVCFEYDTCPVCRGEL